MFGLNQKICSKSTDEFDKWTRQDFLKTYTALSRTGVDGEMCAPLPGLSASGTVKRGDGTLLEYQPRLYEVATGLPWAGEAPKRLGGDAKRQAPRLELKKP